MQRAVNLLVKEDLKSVGLVMCSEDGTLLSSGEIDLKFKVDLARVQEEHPELIAPHIDVHKGFGIYRSLRKGTESLATEQGVEARVIDMINRWRKMDANQKGSMPMRDYSLDMLLIKKIILSYSAAL